MEKSIYIKLTGGLGNQMFQYASALSLALRNNSQLKLEISFYKNQNLRSFELHEAFDISSKIASEHEIHIKFFGINTPILRKLIRGLNMLLPARWRRVHTEEKPEYNESFFQVSPDCLLIGYWQSFHYFENIKPKILEEFKFKHNIPHSLQGLLRKINNNESISIHVRRGDYVSNPDANKIHGTCSLEYYEKAIHHLENKIENCHFFIFSDDISWCKNNLKITSEHYFVEYHEPNSTFIDLQLMSNCKHNIIANSSYSWWGAWLNQAPNKIIIAPMKWNNQDIKFAETLIPKEWIRY